MVRLGRLVVQGVEKIDPELVGLVGEVGEQALVDEVLHLLACDLYQEIKMSFTEGELINTLHD